MLRGIGYLLTGFKLITRSGVKRFVILPLLINLVIYALLLTLTISLFDTLNHWLLDLLPAWLAWLSTILWLIFFMGFLFVAIYSFVVLANIVAAPFNSLLAEKIEELLTGKKPPTPQSVMATLKDTPRILRRQFTIIGYSLPRALVFFMLFFIPIVQIAAPMMWFFFSAWLMSLQYLDYPTDNHHISFQEMRSTAFEHRWLTLGFGSAILIGAMMPIINLFIMPAAVAGATALWIEQRP